MATLMAASNQWASRPADERFTSLPEMFARCSEAKQSTRFVVCPSKRLSCSPVGDDHKGIEISGPNGHGYAPSHWAFGQLATLAKAPAGYMRTLPSEMVSDCLNYGFKVARDVEDVGVQVTKSGIMRAATGPNFGLVWNADVIKALMDQFGDGRTGRFRVPGEFGHDVEITAKNTTLYASDRDMFVFLADEKNRVEIPNRRNGSSGLMARGFIVSQSEVGKATLSLRKFLFDFVCCNRIIWGAESVEEIAIRHTVSAPTRFVEQIVPVLEAYADSSDHRIVETIKAAQAKRMGNQLDKFLSARFSRPMVKSLHAVHELEEQRPIETVFDIVTAVTARAKAIPHQDERVELEITAGKILEMATV